MAVRDNIFNCPKVIEVASLIADPAKREAARLGQSPPCG